MYQASFCDGAWKGTSEAIRTKHSSQIGVREDHGHGGAAAYRVHALRAVEPVGPLWPIQADRLSIRRGQGLDLRVIAEAEYRKLPSARYCR